MKIRFVFLLLFIPLVLMACGGEDDKANGDACGDACGDAACGCGDPVPGDDPERPGVPDDTTPEDPGGPTPQDEQEIDSLVSLTKQLLAELKTIKSLDAATTALPKLKSLGAKITKIGWGKGKEFLSNSKNWSKDSMAKWGPKIKELMKNSLGIWWEKKRINKDDELLKALKDAEDIFPREEPEQEPGG